MKFADIPGHEDAKRRLREMADTGHVPHALLIEGPEGSGKFALARAFAQYLHCTDRRDGDSCGRCRSCIQHEAFSHLDVIYSFPVVKLKGKPTISNDCLDLFRDFLRESPFMDFRLWLTALDNINAQPQIYVEEGNEILRRVSFMTRSAGRKTVLMWLPERLHPDAANKLLKMVEEPFEDTVFVMTSDNPRQILPTIYSRTQRIELKRYSDAELTALLAARGISSGEAADLARVAEGNVNKALELHSGAEEHTMHLELFKSLMRSAYGRKVAELRKWSQDVAALGRERSMEFLDYCSRLVRESLMMHLAEPRLLTLDSAERQFLSRFFPYINERNVIDFTVLLDNARRDIAANGNAKMVFFDMAVRIIILIRR